MQPTTEQKQKPSVPKRSVWHRNERRAHILDARNRCFLPMAWDNVTIADVLKTGGAFFPRARFLPPLAHRKGRFAYGIVQHFHTARLLKNRRRAVGRQPKRGARWNRFNAFLGRRRTAGKISQARAAPSSLLICDYRVRKRDCCRIRIHRIRYRCNACPYCTDIISSLGSMKVPLNVP